MTEEQIRKISENLIFLKDKINETLAIINLKSIETTNINIEDSKEYFEEDSKIVEGYFNGEIMLGPDQKQYSIPSNYISKSKIVEGDKLKLTIKKDGTFIYKQIELIERERLTGILTKDDSGKGFLVLVNNKLYKVQKAAVTYFKGDYGDNVVILIPKNKECIWAAIENIEKNEKKTIEQTNIKEKNKITEIQPIKLEDLK